MYSSINRKSAGSRRNKLAARRILAGAVAGIGAASLFSGSASATVMYYTNTAPQDWTTVADWATNGNNSTVNAAAATPTTW